MSENNNMSRRGFLRLAALTGTALCIEPTLNKVSAAESLITGKKQRKTAQQIIAGLAAIRSQRTLGRGKAAFTVSALGYGCMGLNHKPAPCQGARNRPCASGDRAWSFSLRHSGELRLSPKRAIGGRSFERLH